MVINRKTINLGSHYIYVDLNFLIGSFFILYRIAHDGNITFSEAFIGLFVFIVYSAYLIKGGAGDKDAPPAAAKKTVPLKAIVLLLVAAVGIYFGANYVVSSIQSIAMALHVPEAIIALTVLSLGTTLPELVVHISAIRQGDAEMAVRNVLGSCIFNTLVIPALASSFGAITLPAGLLNFSLPVMAGTAILFYLLTQDKRISVWEGLLFATIYLSFMMKTVTN